MRAQIQIIARVTQLTSYFEESRGAMGFDDRFDAWFKVEVTYESHQQDA
jgi:hypothetical protein